MFGFGRSNTDTPPAGERADNAQNADNGGIGVKSVLGYCYNPNLGTRFSRLGYLFSRFAYTIAQIFAIARLIPQGHPYLNPQNIGKFGFKDVLAVGSANLYFTKENIHQIAVYFGVVISFMISIVIVILTLAQITLGVANVYANSGDGCPAYNPTNGFFHTPENTISTKGGGCITYRTTSTVGEDVNYGDNLALSFLHSVFGVEGFFRDTEGSFQNWRDFSNTGFLSQIVHNMLRVYSQAMLVIAIFILLYIIVSVVADTVQTGVPFGKQFNSVWAPIRLAIGIGLLIPISGGLNSAQLLTLQIAKWGSGLGDRVWYEVQATIENNADRFTAKPLEVGFDDLIYDAIKFSVCRAAYNYEVTDPDMQLVTAVDEKRQATWGSSSPFHELLYRRDTYLVTNNSNKEFRNCGKFEVPWHQFRPGVTIPEDHLLRARAQNIYGATIEAVINNEKTREIGQHIVSYCGDTSPCELDNYIRVSAYVNPRIRDLIDIIATNIYSGPGDPTATPPVPPSRGLTGILYDEASRQIRNELSNSGGWVSAGTMFIRIANINGELVKAVQSVPVDTYTSSSSAIESTNANCNFFERNVFDPLGNCKPNERDQIASRSLQLLDNWWNASGTSGKYTDDSGVEQTVVRLERSRIPSSLQAGDQNSPGFGTYLLEAFYAVGNFYPLYLLRDDGAGGFQGDNPIAKMSAFGASLIQTGTSMFMQGSGVAAAFSKKGFSNVDFLSPVLLAIAGIMFLAGALLHYVLPLLPFVYFFFAVFGWVISVFEALLGMPLFALAHLDVKADGIVGRAKDGYITLFLILIEPALIVISFIGSVVFFTASMNLFHEMFYMAQDVIYDVEGSGNYGNSALDKAANSLLGGENNTVAYDWFMVPIIYAGIAYGVALACFKLIDQLPNKVIRYLQENAQLVGSDSGDALQYLDKAALGAAGAGQSIINALGSKAGGVGDKSQSDEIAAGLKKAGLGGSGGKKSSGNPSADKSNTGNNT
jgi:hypothetical protein